MNILKEGKNDKKTAKFMQTRMAEISVFSFLNITGHWISLIDEYSVFTFSDA